jgi:hypothetical protein
VDVPRIEDRFSRHWVKIGMELFQTLDDVPRMVVLLQRRTFRFLNVTVRHQATKRDQFTEHAKLQEAKFAAPAFAQQAPNARQDDQTWSSRVHVYTPDHYQGNGDVKDSVAT